MVDKLKNWWFAILGIALIVLDQGFEVIKPFLIEIGMSGKYMGWLRISFALYGIYRLKNQLPTTNTEKLKEIVKNKVSADGDEPIVGDRPKDRG